MCLPRAVLADAPRSMTQGRCRLLRPDVSPHPAWPPQPYYPQPPIELSRLELPTEVPRLWQALLTPLTPHC